ncbi:uncharacterized protein LOC132945389 [Metopolophium dirhodum]|uniref:uncharacterized protein LOC132945389 n=1 Tax=Metopolophium dirhodum TaxID=44670 RepID=UPI00298F8B07|nr:uncharacterized protein LOC132945389 [Metopolophium dirhodum]
MYSCHTLKPDQSAMKTANRRGINIGTFSVGVRDQLLPSVHPVQTLATTLDWRISTYTMGGRRGKRNRTPPVTEPKKLRNGTYSPPPLLVATSQRQRAEPPSPDQSDSESLSGESYASSVNSRPTSDISETDRQMASVSAPSSTLSSESLKKVGFSDDFGFINYCFAKQFVDILVAFFELSTSYSNAHDYLYEPRLFCYKEINKKSFLTCVFCNLPPAELESPGKCTNSTYI